MPRWTPESRAKQAELIRRWRPWEQSTGPKTAEGKAVSSMNARVHGLYDGALLAAMRQQAPRIAALRRLATRIRRRMMRKVWRNRHREAY